MRELSAKAFLEALKGETTTDLNGVQFSFINPDTIPIVEVRNVRVTEDVFVLPETHFRYPVNFTSCEFDGLFEICGGVFQHWVTIEGGNFRDEFKISGGVFKQNFKITDGINYSPLFDSLFTIEGGSFLKRFEIDGGTFNYNFNIEHATFKGAFEINGGHFTEKFNIRGGVFSSIQVYNEEGTFINELCVYLQTDFEIRIGGIIINKMLFRNHFLSTGSLYVKNLTINQLQFIDLENDGKISFADVAACQSLESDGEPTTQSTLPIISFWNSDLGNFSFFNTDFCSFDKIVFKDSRVSDIKTVNKHLPISTEKPIFTGSKEEKDTLYLEEFYNQLYLAMQKQGNRTQEIKYYSEYLDLHRINSREWYTRTSLCIHKITSNYGKNWWKALVLILIIGWIFYFFYSISLPEVCFGIHFLSWTNFSYHLKYFIQFLLPTHSFALIPDTNPTGYSVLIDALGRVFIGFLIYQTISAFRRFGKK